MKNLLEAMNFLTTKVLSMESRIADLEVNSQESGQEKNNQQRKQDIPNGAKSKLGRVDEEKYRSLKVLMDDMHGEKGRSSGVHNKQKSRKPNSGPHRKGRRKESSSSTDNSDCSIVGMGQMKKRMSRRQRDLCSTKTASRIKQAGGTYPETDYEHTDFSGKGSDTTGCCKHRSNKVKSGALVKKRPAKVQELWPHTIAIEDHGEEVDSNTIGLSTFFSSFTRIMTRCKGVEYRGRSELLHAVSMVLKNLSWSEARTFHNLVMVKLEQQRISWDDDFLGMACDFMDDKVRASMKSKHAAANASQRYNYNKGAGKGFRGQSQRSDFTTGRGKAIYGVFCGQWNYGTCSYGNNCKRWHCCKTCGEQGKLGETHKASTHGSGGNRSADRP